MYMCSCHAVTDGQIKKEVVTGCPTWKALTIRTGVGTQCGTCARDAKALFDRLKKEREAEQQKPDESLAAKT